MTGDSIIRIAARGDGVTANGRHVAGTVPGDMVAADGSILHGPHHIAPVCRHFGKCGGCQLQFGDEQVLTDFVRDRVTNALSAQKLTAENILPPHLSPTGTRRRATLRALRPGKPVLLGYMAGGSHRLIDLGECPVLHPALAGLIAPLRALLSQLMAPRSDVRITLTLADQGVDVLLTGVTALGLQAHDALMDFCGGHPIARLAIDAGEGPEDRWAPEPVTATLGGHAVALPYGAFLQATADGEAALVAAVRCILGDAPRVADLFAGLGTFALSMGGARDVLTAEAARDAALALKATVNRATLPIRVEHRDLYRRPLTAKELAEFDGVILDPPRAGAEEQVHALAASPVPKIAYVSCNPASFARDAAILTAGGYQIGDILPVGQFRWSTHVELVAALHR